MFGRNDDNQATADPALAGFNPAADPNVGAPIPDATLGGGSVAGPAIVAPTAPPPMPSPAHLTVPGPTIDTTATATASPTSTPAIPDDLITIKQGALQDLSPLLGHLDQSPEEKFRTTMMLIQATDDHTKLQEAYDTAKQIADEKARAQALLDVVNEINYFTQQHHASPAN